MQLETVAIPTVTRTSGKPKEPNPFIDGEFGDAIRNLPVDAPAGTAGAALAVEVPGILDKTNKEYAKVSRQIRDAGNARGVTMRQIHTAVKGADDKPSVKITFFAVTKVERRTKAEIEAERKEAADLAASEAEMPEANTEGDDEIAPAKTPVKRGTARTGK